MNQIYTIYQTLYKHYGAQGWWPTFDENIKDKTFEVALGSILTQNTTFTSVETSLQNLHVENAIDPDVILNMNIDKFKTLIKPSGYYNQKAEYILAFIKFYKALDGRTPSRDDLLHVKGIGEETADSILLYGYEQCEFKIDAYTKRLLIELGLVDAKVKYKEMKKLMQDSLTQEIKDKKELLKVYQEYHALIVAHGKKFYSKKPYGVGCFLKN
ncbi:endonuclease III domain-containing protein [Sulfurimonas sp.]|nr:endonuclease III domain-containing protein [Sulfurimonas sp.]